MAFVRSKRHGNRQYYYLVENYNDHGKIRQRVLKYLGTKPPMGRQKHLKGSGPSSVKGAVPHEDTFVLSPEIAEGLTVNG